MINIKDLKVGQRLYVVQKEFERGIHRRELDEVIKTRVIRVGLESINSIIDKY